MGTPTNGDALSVLVSKLQNAGGTTVAFVTGYFPRKEQPHFVVACGPGTYADDIARGRVQLSSLSLWKNADGSIRRICGESDIVPLCEDSCSPAELAALKKALAKPPPGSTGKRGSDAGAAGGGTGSTPAKRRSTGEGAAGAAAAASPSASVLVVDLFALVRESRQASLAPLLATNGAARNKIIARLERVLAAVGSRASEEAACNKFGAPYIKKLFPATHKALLIEVLNLPSTQQLCAPANEN